MNVTGITLVRRHGARTAAIATAALFGMALPGSAQEAAAPVQTPMPVTTAAVSSAPLLALASPATSAETGESSSNDAAALLDAPSAVLQQQQPEITTGTSTAPLEASILNGPPNSPNMPMERRYRKYIRPGYRGQPLNVREKVDLGLIDAVSLSNLGATFIAAGYSHVLNEQPNYGTNSGAFAERVGAAGVREFTEGVFTDSVFSVLEKEDPRYYIMGPKYGYVRRTLYSITRPLITRTDSGHSSPNGALLSGYAASAALALTYYPSENRNFHDAASNFGGSIGGAALGFFVDEFQDDFLIALHLKKKP